MLINEFENQNISKDNIYYTSYDTVKKFANPKISEAKKNLEIVKVNDLPKILYSQAPIGISSKVASNERQQLLKPVETFEEYRNLLNEILEYEVPDSVSYLTEFISTKGYEKVPIELLGLVSYCGCSDKSDEINRWLSGRPSTQSTLPDEKMANIVRALDYSLKKLDERYSKYEGIAYRIGFFNPNTDKQFYSSSLSHKFANKHLIYPQDTGNNNIFSIIKVKNGHKIYKFQQDANSKISKRFAKSEEEILIDRKSKFKLIPKEKYTEEDIELIRGICEKLPKNIEDYVWKHIDIWEEI